jgi:hypothetical protein
MAFQSEFADNQKLNACAANDGDHIGEQFAPKGPWVVLIKKALNAWAAKQRPPVAALTISDVFSKETGDRVALYKTKQRPPILNVAGQIDRIVGKKTVVALDKELPSGGGGSSIGPDMQVVNRADVARLSALLRAETEIVRLKREFEPGAPDESDNVVKAMQRQLFIVLDSRFWDITNQFLSFIRTNRLIRTTFKIDRSVTTEFAHVEGSLAPGDGVTFADPFFTTNENCRNEVITHEFFHFVVGAQHFYDARTNGDAMRCPHHLARAVFDITVGQQLAACSGSGNICR